MAKKIIKPADVESPEVGSSSLSTALIQPVTEKPSFIELIKFTAKDTSIATIKKKREEYDKIVIAGVEDTANYKTVVSNMSQMRDDRRAFENAAYENIIDPLKKALKEYAEDIDAVVEEFKAGEKSERDKKDFIDEEKKRIKKDKEEAKAKLIQTRISELFTYGAKFSGQTYSFDYDAGLSINTLQMQDYSDEEYSEFINDVKASYEFEENRKVEKIRADEAEAERQRGITEANESAAKALSEKRTKLRIKELLLMGFKLNDDPHESDMYHHALTNDFTHLSVIEDVSDEEWEHMVAQMESHIENHVEPTPVLDNVIDFTPVTEQAYDSNQMAHVDVQHVSFPFTVDQAVAVVMPPLDVTVGINFNSGGNQFIDFDISGKLKMRLYPVEFMGQAMEGVDKVGNSGVVQGLNWCIIPK